MTATVRAADSAALHRMGSLQNSLDPNVFSAPSWQALGAESSDEAFVAAWLGMLRSTVPQMVAARVQLDEGPAFRWPAASSHEGTDRMQALTDRAEVAKRHAKPLLRPASGGHFLLASPIVVGGAACGARVIEITAASELVPKDAMSALLWGAPGCAIGFSSGEPTNSLHEPSGALVLWRSSLQRSIRTHS